MKITHVAEIVNITNVAGILEAEIFGAENMHAIPMYNLKKDAAFIRLRTLSELNGNFPMLPLAKLWLESAPKCMQ